MKVESLTIADYPAGPSTIETHFAGTPGVYYLPVPAAGFVEGRWYEWNVLPDGSASVAASGNRKARRRKDSK